MIPGGTTIGEVALSSLRDDGSNRRTAEFSAILRMEGYVLSPYVSFVTDERIKKVYALEITVRTLRQEFRGVYDSFWLDEDGEIFTDEDGTVFSMEDGDV